LQRAPQQQWMAALRASGMSSGNVRQQPRGGVFGGIGIRPQSKPVFSRDFGSAQDIKVIIFKSITV
jgi:hypothetical protein